MKTQSIVNITETEHLFKEHYTFLCLLSFSILKDRDAARDVVQDFFISYWQKKQSITIKISFRAYASGAVRNLSLIAIKKSSKDQPLDEFILNHHEVQGHTTLDKCNVDEKLWALLNQLPQSRKEIFISSVVHGQTYAEISELNGISVNTVKTQMKRAYAFLRLKAKKSDLIYKT